MSLLNVVEAGDLAQSFANPTRSAGNRVLTDVVSSSSLSELSGQRFRPSRNARNAGARSMGARAEPFWRRWRACLKDPELLRSGTWSR